MHYQPTLQAIQLFGVLFSKHSAALKEPIREWMNAKCLGIALLGLCYRFYFDKNKHMREWMGQVREEGPCAWDSLQVASCIREW